MTDDPHPPTHNVSGKRPEEREPEERIETHCSHLEDGKRWCNFCFKEIFPEDAGHEPGCPIGQMKSAFYILRRLSDEDPVALVKEALARAGGDAYFLLIVAREEGTRLSTSIPLEDVPLFLQEILDQWQPTPTPAQTNSSKPSTRSP